MQQVSKANINQSTERPARVEGALHLFCSRKNEMDNEMNISIYLNNWRYDRGKDCPRVIVQSGGSFNMSECSPFLIANPNSH